MGLPYRVNTVITKPTGASVSGTIDFPSRCDLRSIVVRQENPDNTSGTDAFNVDVFDQDPSGFSASNPEEIHKVIPTQLGAGGVMEYFHPGNGQAYMNMDTIPATRSSLLKRIYVRISGAGTNKFRVGLAASLPLDSAR